MNLLGKNFAFVLLLFISMSGAITSYLELLSQYFVSEAEQETSRFFSTKDRIGRVSLNADVENIYQAWKQVESYAFLDVNAHVGLGRAALVLASITDNREAQADLFCESLSQFAMAVKAQPLNAGHHISFADLQLQIPNPNSLCNTIENRSYDFKTDMSYLERLQHARGLYPFGVKEMYLASLVYMAAGKKYEALSLLRQNQELNPLFTRAQRHWLFSQINSQEELSAALPRKYPEVENWINYFIQNRSLDYSSWLGVFESAVESSIDELVNRYKDGKLTQDDFSLFIKSLSGKSISHRSENLRRRFDLLLADIFEIEGNEDWSRMLRQRATLRRVPVLKSVIADEINPSGVMLFGWYRDWESRLAYFDNIGRSFGIFLPGSESAKYVYLSSLYGQSGLTGRDIGLAASFDNHRYHEVKGDYQIYSFVVDGRETLVIDVSKLKFRFLKIRYKGAGRDQKFTHSLQQLVQVYG